MFLSTLSACHSVSRTPEGRAQEFIEALVTEPTDTEKLREIANIGPDRNPENLVDDLSVRVALDFLRAKLAQGATFKFVPTEVRRMDAKRHAVAILVTYLQSGSPTNDEVRFEVLVEKDNQNHWRIAHVTGGN